MKTTASYKLRDKVIVMRILKFLREKQAAGESANTRQIAAATDVRRYLVVLKMPLLINDGSVIMTGRYEIHCGHILPHYTLNTGS